MRVKARVTVTVLLAVSGLVLGACGSSSGPDTAAPKDQAEAFLDRAAASDVNGVCALLTERYRKLLAPPAGRCFDALHNLTLYTDADGEDTLSRKKVTDVEVNAEGDEAIVTLVDRVTQEHELPMRLVLRDGTWLIDELGAGAQISEACMTEQAAVRAAVDEYLSDHTEYPADTKSLVPGYLPKLPDNHSVGTDGKVVATGVCA